MSPAAAWTISCIRARLSVRRSRARSRSPRADWCSSTGTRCDTVSRRWPQASGASRSRLNTSPMRACIAGAASSPPRRIRSRISDSARYSAADARGGRASRAARTEAMTRAAPWLLAAGALLFVLVLSSHDLSAIFGILAVAGFGLLGVTLFHLVPLILDAAAIRVLQSAARPGAMLDAIRVRWIGESANSLMPAGQIGGPLLMIRQLTQRGEAAPAAVAAITVSTTLQSFAQVVFALMGVALMATDLAGISAGRASGGDLREPLLVGRAHRLRLPHRTDGGVLRPAAPRPVRRRDAVRAALCRSPRLVASREACRGHRRGAYRHLCPARCGLA